MEPGRRWGEPATPPADAVEAHLDSEAGAIVAHSLEAGQEPPPIVLRGGDLFRALGGAQGRRTPGARFRVDVGRVSHDGGRGFFVAHLIARRSWWRGRLVAAMNTEFLGTWQVAPRAHPGDGLLDLVDANPRLSQRLLARRRLAHGGHLPHPDITSRRMSAIDLDLGRPLDLWLDGSKTARSTRVRLEVLPECLIVYL